MNYYSTTQTLKEWVNTIEVKFNDLPLKDSVKQITTILSIDDKREITKITKASLIVYAKKLGVLTFEDACKKLGISPTLPDVSNILPTYQKKQIAFHKLCVIAEVLNNGWEPDWNNPSQYKYFPWFDLKEGFSYYAAIIYSTNTDVPSALCFEDTELAEFMGRYFIDLYKDYLIK
jgi:hypothetical protein